MGIFRNRVAKGMVLASLPLLAACGASETRPVSAGTIAAPPPTGTVNPRPHTPPPTQPSRPTDGFLAPRVMSMPGLEAVIGERASALERQFGSPDLDVREGDVRKLQYRGTACVLDIYLYPLSPGAEPTATYVDARRASDGLDVDRAACVAALKR